MPTELGDAVRRLAEVDPEGRSGLVAEDHVLLDRQVVGQHEVLVHHADADGDGVARRLEALLDASNGDRALVRPLLAVEDLHQRRLAGAVLADDGVDRARPDGEVDPVVRDDAGNRLTMPFSSIAAGPDAPGAPSDEAAAPPACSVMDRSLRTSGSCDPTELSEP